jgi:hypothetical protein
VQNKDKGSESFLLGRHFTIMIQRWLFKLNWPRAVKINAMQIKKRFQSIQIKIMAFKFY